MTDSPVVDLSSVRGTDAGRVGPKMARLGQLAADGWRVPDGYAVTASALDGWLPAPARAELARLFTTPASGPGELLPLPELAARARALVESQPLPSWLEDAVAAAHARLAARVSARVSARASARAGQGDALRVAVRSSAVSEDGHAASFAGQYETYLGVSGVADVLLHVRRCWASGFSAHALSYRRRFGGPAPVRVHDLAVGVLELVDARSAGVAFTLDPVTGDRGVCVVEGNWGFGESVVSGHVSPDHWTVDRGTGQVRTERVGAKLTWAAYSETAGRVELSPLPADLTGKACLSSEEVRHICERAMAIETAAGGVPQDVEWAVARDMPFPDCVYILQHRPETTWTTPLPARESKSAEGGAAEGGRPSFDPVQYALRNVFKVPGT